MDVWQKEMARWVDLKTILFFECEEKELIKRLVNRGLTSGRADDNEQIIQKRLTVFNGLTKPVVDHYTKEGKLTKINANQSIEKITAIVESHLDEIGVFPRVIKETKPKAFLILGSSGSGKGTQCKRMAKAHGFYHICTGDLLRKEMTENGRHKQIIEESMRLGKLVPTDIVVRLMKH